MLGGPVSVAVIEKVESELAPFSVTAKTCTPLSPAANVWFPGKVTLGLSVVIATVPTYPVATLPNESRAVTVTEPGVPAVTGVGKPATWSVAATSGFTAIPAWLPVMLGGPGSVAVREEVGAGLA